MLSFLPQSSTNKTRAYSFVLLIVLLLGGVYFFNKISIQMQTLTTDTQEPKSTSAAYFIPPESTKKEISVTGKVVKAFEGEKLKATHKIVDANNNILVYATTTDDKLLQQEGNFVTLVGNIPISQNISPDAVMEVMYISYK